MENKQTTDNVSVSSADLKAGIEKEESDGKNLQADYDKQKKVSSGLQNKLDTARTWDIWVKIGIRVILTLAFLGILVGQNWFVYQLVNHAITTNQLKDVQLILGTLIAGTLTETYFVVKEIVKWAMKEIDYN